MQYRKNIKNNDNLSLLGLGCLRFFNKRGTIDEDVGIDLIRKAIKAGVNYFDTAYIYLNGQSEVILGKALKDGYRDKAFIATKLPHFLVRKPKDIEKLFNTSLQRLQTDYIDYYLIHMLCDIAVWNKLEKFGIKQWIKDKKEKGIIKNIGFSFHGRYEEFENLIEAYDWDFCQIQYNYLDINYQAGTAGLRYANKKGLPIIIMEPLRGGLLVNGLPKEAGKLLEEKNITPQELGLSWLFDQPEVTVALSGMSSEEQLNDNVVLTDKYPANSLSAEQKQLATEVKKLIDVNIKVPCTACRYCMPCPSGVNIPACFATYNEKYTLKHKKTLLNYERNTGSYGSKPGNAGQCTNCGACVKLCPQNINIPVELAAVKKDIETPFFKFHNSATRILFGTKNKD